MKRLVVLFVLLAVCAAGPLFAADKRFKVFGAAAWVGPLSDEDIDLVGTVEAADAYGWNIGFEWKFTDRLAIEVDYLNATHDIEVDGEEVAEVDFEPLSASLNIHLIGGEAVNLYVGPVASWVNWGDIESDLGDEGTDTEFAWGAQIGFDIGLGDTVAIVTGLRYLNLDLTGDDDEVGVDPLIARAGIGIRF